MPPKKLVGLMAGSKAAGRVAGIANMATSSQRGRVSRNSITMQNVFPERIFSNRFIPKKILDYLGKESTWRMFKEIYEKQHGDAIRRTADMHKLCRNLRCKKIISEGFASKILIDLAMVTDQALRGMNKISLAKKPNRNSLVWHEHYLNGLRHLWPHLPATVKARIIAMVKT